ncbi:MAG: ABC transporter permease subunit [Phycisphaerales bacterium]|nr:MAG: ABC transporter permease subunit [Phycisphaerales bacterium]
MRLRALNPVYWASQLRSPIFAKEVYVAGRKSGPFLQRMIYTLVLLVIGTLIYVGMMSTGRGVRSGLAQLSLLETIAPALTIGTVAVQGVFMLLVPPILTSAQLCDERRKGTLSALLTTPLTSMQIVLGKLFACLVQVIVLALVSLPVLLAVRVFGGVSTETIIGFEAMLLAFAISGCSIGLACSVNAKTPLRAASMAFGWIVLLNGLLSLGVMMIAVARQVGGFPIVEFAIAGSCSTPFAVILLMTQLMGDAPPMLVMPVVWANVGWNLFLAIVFVLLAVARFRKAMLKEATGEAASAVAVASPNTPTTSTPQASPGTPDPVVGVAASGVPSLPPAIPQPVAGVTLPQTRVSREVGDQPVLWREMRQPIFRSKKSSIAAAIVGVAIVIFLHVMIMVKGGDEENHAILATVAVCASGFIYFILATIGTTDAITGERESRALDVLLTTPMARIEILAGKYWGVVRRFTLVPLICAAYVFVVALLSPGARSIPIAIELLLAMFSGVILLAASGIFFSTISRSTTRAAVHNLAFMIGVWVVPFVLLAMADAFLGIHDSDDAAQALALAHPPAHVVCTLVSGLHDRGYGSSRPPVDLFDIGRVTHLQYIMVLAGLLIVHVLAAGALLAWAARLVDRRHQVLGK